MEAETPQGTTSSSADRMVGMEHSEVRYFTRYGFDNVDSCWFFFLFADNHIVTTITVNNDPSSHKCIMICLQMCCLTINLLHHAGIHEEMLVSAFKSNQTHFPSQWI